MHSSTKILNSFLISAALLFTACNEKEQTQVKKVTPPLSINAITVKKEPVPIWKQYTGTTKAKSDQAVRARVSGILEAVYFEDGASVKKGQKLFKIEQTEYKAALDEAVANKQKSEASYQRATADVNRYKPLVKEGLAPKATLDQYQAEQARYKAAIASAQAKIKIAKLNLSYTIIKAPISGRVSANLVDVGNLVGQGESTILTTIMSIDPIYAYFSPSQKDILIFQKYSKKENPDAFVEVKGHLETLRFNGTVDFKNNQVDQSTSTISMRATIKNPDAKLLPGTFVYVNVFINDEIPFTMIPPEVIFTDQLGQYIYIVGEDNKAKKVGIKTGYETKDYVSVKEGLKDGDRVIVSALAKLRNGLNIKATDTTDKDGIQAILKKKNLIPQTSK